MNKAKYTEALASGGELNVTEISQWYNHLSHPNCFPIKSEQDLTSVISDYEYCKLRAKEVSTLLFHK